MAQNENFEHLVKEARGAKNLDELFCLWKQAHEIEPNWKDTCTLSDREAAKSNFVYDGRFGSAKEGGVLFICKESNVGNDTDFGEKEFWLKKVVETKFENNKAYYPANADTTARRIQTKFFNCLTMTAEKASEQSRYNLFDCAYMNLNKRGGKSEADNGKIEAYAKKYEEFILKEIKLLNCKKIVLFSAGSLPYVKDTLLPQTRLPIIIINCHPSRYSKEKIEKGIATQ